MARPSKALLRFVELYTQGPTHMLGQWDMCANGAGMKEVPLKSDPMVRRMIEEAGGIVLDVDVKPETEVKVDALEAVLGGGFEGIPWAQLRSELTDVIKSIASGTTQARAAQVQAIQLIIKKAEDEAKEQEVVHSVIILPTQGVGAEMVIDEEWIAKIKRMEVKEEEEDD